MNAGNAEAPTITGPGPADVPSAPRLSLANDSMVQGQLDLYLFRNRARGLAP